MMQSVAGSLRRLWLNASSCAWVVWSSSCGLGLAMLGRGVAVVALGLVGCSLVASGPDMHGKQC